jgi:hypothetical protein
MFPIWTETGKEWAIFLIPFSYLSALKLEKNFTLKLAILVHCLLTRTTIQLKCLTFVIHYRFPVYELDRRIRGILSGCTLHELVSNAHNVFKTLHYSVNSSTS